MAKASSDPSTPPSNGRCLFFPQARDDGKPAIPAEIRVKIFKLAYTRTEVREITLWREAETRKRKIEGYGTSKLGPLFPSKAHRVKQFDHSGTCHFLVCRSWLSEACPVYFESNTFYLRCTESLLRFLLIPCVKENIRSVSFDYATLPHADTFENAIRKALTESKPATRFLEYAPDQVHQDLNASPKLTNVDVGMPFIGRNAYSETGTMFSKPFLHERLEQFMRDGIRKAKKDLSSLRGLHDGFSMRSIYETIPSFEEGLKKVVDETYLPLVTLPRKVTVAEKGERDKAGASGSETAGATKVK